MSYSKIFVDKTRFLREQEGHAFFMRYFPQVPHLLEIHDTQDQYEIVYEDVAAGGVPTIADTLVANQIVNIQWLLSGLADLAKCHAHIRRAEGGTVHFYLSRLDRLRDPRLILRYREFTDRRPMLQINGTITLADPLLLTKLTEAIEHYNVGLCIPSQGDFHERNIISSGYIVDFEAGGWNLLTSELSTFIEHTLFVGNYFGPLYAAWSTARDMQLLNAHPRQIRLDGSSITVSINDARTDLMQQYMRNYVDKLPLTRAIYDNASLGVAYRLLTVFDVANMSTVDSDIAFGLANYFAGTSIPFLAKLQRICKWHLSGSICN